MMFHIIRSMSKWSYFHNVGKNPLMNFTVGKLLEKAATRFPNRPALISVHQNKTISYKELLIKADTLAGAFKKLGLKKGERVGIWAPNLLEWQITCMACSRAGCILVQLNPAYQAKEMEYCINKVQVKALVCPDKIKKFEFYDILNRIDQGINKHGRSDRIPSLESIIIISEENYDGTYNFNKLLNDVTNAEIEAVKEEHDLVQIDDGFNIQFTSGSTGLPKAALLSHFNVVNNSFSMAKMRDNNRDDQKVCVQVPFFHTFGTTVGIIGSLHIGSTLVIPDSTYNPKANLKAIQDQKCSVIFGTPTMYVDLINAQKEMNLEIDPDISIIGGSPASPALISDMYSILKLKHIVPIYGLTETTCAVFHGDMETNAEDAKNTVGKLSQHVEAKVIDEQGRMVEFGKAGELCIRGYTVMLGYWNDEQKTKDTMGQGFWLKTGDKFILHENGVGQIVGRIKDLIIRGGENIYPKEIEDILNEHPDIIESQVVGLPDERLGEIVCACVRIKSEGEMSKESVAKFCSGKMAHFKIPTKVVTVKEFPKTASGKIQKFKIIESILK